MDRRKNIVGWIGVVLTILITSFWTYWGAFENFHEGWYHESIFENIIMLLLQYMGIALLFLILSLIILKSKVVGLILHIAVGIFCAIFFSGGKFEVVVLLIAMPFLILGALYFYGDPKPKIIVYRLIILVPLFIFLVISIPQGIKVSQRVNDHDFGIRTVQGNEVELAWAPRGPGWPDRGVSWNEANDICKYLSDDGKELMDKEQNIWRLPTVDEAVRSMMLHGENAKGIWNTEAAVAEYEIDPDKESPLWDVNSPIIYYWTADTSQTDEERAYIIVYHGGVYDRRKDSHQRYLSFRAVKEIKSENSIED